MKHQDTVKELFLKLVDKDRTYKEYEVHSENGKRVCICSECNFTRGYNKRGEEIRKEIEDFFK